MPKFKTRNGYAQPFGAWLTEDGVNFSIFSEHAQKIELCLFDDLGQKEIARINMYRGENHCWHIFVCELTAGAKYGYRVHGEFAPEKGLRFNANKLLIDPYARELDRSFCWDKSVFGYDLKSVQKDLSFSDLDSAHMMPKSVVTTRKTHAEVEAIQQRKPCIPWRETVIYETHVRGISQLNLNLPSMERGTLAALASPQMIKHFKQLGVTAIELLPMHTFVDEEFLVKQGLSNYWGYNTLNFFTPHHDYLASGRRQEFLDTVEALHEAGLEVILDVVYNHTAESNEFGPTLSFRGIDNLSYYRLNPSTPRHYINDTGCGNTFRSEHPRAMQLIMDSLRFWAGEMGVDGFRFDLASILGRNQKGFNRQCAFFQALTQDPLLSTCKMIAEPWDIGPGGYQLGGYPGEWSEWNDKYRDVCRRFWRGDGGILPDFARRIHGSSDLFEYAGRGPRASVNFITSHDGFSLHDVVAYNDRHNEANNENNQDGHHANFSANYGAEGPTKDAAILEVRRRQQRNMLATLLFSQGTPMILAGDELGRSQMGNNNAYCQDNEINWLDWRKQEKSYSDLAKFVSKAIAIRKSHALFTSQRYIHTPETLETEHKCARWVSMLGKPMADADWNTADKNVVGWILQSVINKKSTMLLLIFNAHHEKVDFVLPDEAEVKEWQVLLDTISETGEPKVTKLKAKSTVAMEGRSLKLLKAQ